jgi:hypothetical protein
MICILVNIKNVYVRMLKDSLGEFITNNSFFSASLVREQTRLLFSSNDKSNGTKHVFFELMLTLDLIILNHLFLSVHLIILTKKKICLY